MSYISTTAPQKRNLEFHIPPTLSILRITEQQSSRKWLIIFLSRHHAFLDLLALLPEPSLLIRLLVDIITTVRAKLASTS